MDGDWVRIIFSHTSETAQGLQQQAQTLYDIYDYVRRSSDGLLGAGFEAAFRAEIEARAEAIQRRVYALSLEVDEAGRDLMTGSQRLREMDAECAALFEALQAEYLVAPSVMGFLGLEDLWHFAFDPYTLEEAADYLDDTAAGQDLLKQAEANKVGFKLPDGTIIGYTGKDGTLIPITIDDASVGSALYDPKNKSIVVSNDFWQRFAMRGDKNGLAALLGHEMQHAVDHAGGLMAGPDLSASALKGKSLAQVQEDVRKAVIQQVETENRAYARGGAIEADKSYTDDGVLTKTEAEKVLHHSLGGQYKNYEAYYEQAIGEMDYFKNNGIEVDVWVDSGGQVQVSLMQQADYIPAVNA
ncbi:MAG TPA: hypothetical protein VHP83_08670 [Aggregatilineaceae bacterium]|nr:hypothetical protein [Aggregatilineaceae bacterium]